MTPDSCDRYPEHIAIIMDGNNRWAKAKGLPSKSGHRHGAETARSIVSACLDHNIDYLTLFTFSSENWMRASTEVNSLMALFFSVLKRKEIKQFHERNVRFRFIGNRSGFSKKLQRSMREVEELTNENSGITVIVAADYGGRWDITNAARLIASKIECGELKSEDVDIDLINRHTSLSDFPYPDLCIRTGGEHRISNFLLWQFAYTEFYFTDCFWPDFNEREFQKALDNFASRQRRFGGHMEQ